MARELLGLATTAKIGGHPIHPMLIPFPIAFLVAAFLCDLAYWILAETFWADASVWAIGSALVFSLAAAVAGLADFFGNPAIRALTTAWQHMIGNIVAVLLSFGNFALRLSQGSSEAVLPWGFTLSAVVVLLLLYTGWKGGDLVYRHRVGMHPEATKENTEQVPSRRTAIP